MSGPNGFPYILGFRNSQKSVSQKFNISGMETIPLEHLCFPLTHRMSRRQQVIEQLCRRYFSILTIWNLHIKTSSIKCTTSCHPHPQVYPFCLASPARFCSHSSTPSSVLHPPSSVLHPLSSVLRPPSSAIRPLSSVLCHLL
jgi:hypothetical protein